MAERFGKGKGAKRIDQEIEKRLENDKRLINFAKTLNTLYEGAADIQKEIQQEQGKQQTQLGKNSKIYKELRDIAKDHNDLISRSNVGKGVFNRLTRQNTATAKLNQVLVERQLSGEKDKYDTFKKQYDVSQDALETAYEGLGLLKQRTPLENKLLQVQDKYAESYDEMTPKERELMELQMRRMKVAIRMEKVQTAINDVLGEQATSIKNLVKSARTFLNPFTAVLGILAASIARVFTLDKALTDGARSAGALRSQFEGVSSELADSRGELLKFGVDSGMANKIAGEIAKNQGVITTDIAKATVEVAKFASVLGMSEADSAKLFTDFQGVLGVSADSVGNVLELAQGMSAAAGVPLAGVLEDVKNMSEETAALFAGNPQQLLKASIEARSLGLSVDQITKSLGSVTDIQGQFNKQAELSALLGKRVNLLEVQRLKFQGKTTEAVEALNKQLFTSTTASGRLAEFDKLDVVRKSKIAEAAGLTVKEFRNQFEIQKKQSQLSATQLKQIQEERDLQQRIASQGKALLDRITKLFSPLIEKAITFSLNFLEGLDFTPYIQKLSDFLKSDTAMSIKDSIVEGFKVALEISKKIFSFMQENPKLAIGLALGAGALMKGIMMLKGGAFGGIMKFAPMAMKALPAIAGLAGVIAGGFMAVKNIGTIFSKDEKTKDIEKTKAMSSMAGMAVGGTVGFALGGPIGAAIGASIGGAIGQMDFGQKLIGNILSQDTIDRLKGVVVMIKGMADAAINAFMGAEGESIGSRIGKAIGAAFAAFDLVKAIGASLTIAEDLLIIVGDIIGGVFGATGFGLKMSNAIRSGIDTVISYFATIPDRFRLIGAKLDAKITEALVFDIKGVRVFGASDEEIAAKQARVRQLDQEIKDRMDKRTLGAKGGPAGENADFSVSTVNDAIIKPDGQVVRFSPDDTAVLAREGIAPDMSETNELLKQLIAQQGGGQSTIQLNIDGKKVGQAIANSRYRE